MGGIDEALCRCRREKLREPLLGGQVNSGWHAAEVSVHDTRPRRTVQFGVRLAEQGDISAIILPARWNPAGDIINDPEHGDDGGGGGAEEVDITAIILPARWNPAGNIINDPEHGDDGGGVDGELPGLIVEGHI